MKKILLPIFTLIMFTVVGCSEESAADYNKADTSSEDLNQLAARSSAWGGEIGIEEGGAFKITADESALKADLENTLRAEGYSTTIQSLNIVKKTASNDPADSAFMLVGTDNNRISIGVWLVKQNSQLSMDNSAAGSVTCSGCAEGCNLSYFYVNGKRIAYCYEGGCDYDCTKSESSLY